MRSMLPSMENMILHNYILAHISYTYLHHTHTHIKMVRMIHTKMIIVATNWAINYESFLISFMNSYNFLNYPQ